MSLVQLFKNFPAQNIADAVLEGHMGEAFSDHSENPTIGMLVLPNFVMFAGNPNAPILEKWLDEMTLPAQVIVDSPELEKIIQARFPDQIKIFNRTIFTHETINPDALLPHFTDLPSNLEILPIDEEISEEALKYPWSKYFVCSFNDFDDFQNRGKGFVLKKDGEMVSGASTFCLFDGGKGIEIEIDTHPDHRRQGHATRIGAKLIHHCLQNGYTPHWDAKTDISKALAAKFGYSPVSHYKDFFIKPL